MTPSNGASDAGERLHLLQAVHIGFVRVHGLLGGGNAGLGFGDLRFIHGEVGLFLIGFLAGYDAALGQAAASARR